MPVVADIDTNDYTAAGIEISEDDAVIATNTKKYAVEFMLTETGLDGINPSKIITVDESHIKVPAIGIYAFENLSGSIKGIEGELTEGWNIAYLTIDTSTYEVTDAEIVNNANINEYVIFENSDENVLTYTGLNSETIFDGVFVED